MSQAHNKSAVVKAIIGNGLVALFKGIAAFLSGSGAMLAETIHSVVDTLNQCLLLIGVTRAARHPTLQHPYGFGIEASFWGLLAAIGIMVFGGGWTILHGLEQLAHPDVPTHLIWVFSVLGVATVIEGWVLFSVLKTVASTRSDHSWLEHVKRQPPGTITVILEDSAAVLGCLLAAVAVGVSIATQNGLYDALAQLAIGGMLACVGLFLVWRSRRVLIGLSLPSAHVQEIAAFIADLDGVDRVTDIKTRQLTASTFKLKAEIAFSGGELAGRIMRESVVAMKEAGDDDEIAEQLGRFADRLIRALAEHVDWMETEVRRAYPGAIHIDFEPHKDT